MSLIRETLNEKKEMCKTTWMISLHLRWSFCVLYTNFKQTLPPTKFLKCLRAFLNGLLWAAEKSPTGEVAGSPVISRFLLSTSSKVLRREGERRVGEGVEGSCKPKKNKFSSIHNHFFFLIQFQNLINSNTEWPHYLITCMV